MEVSNPRIQNKWNKELKKSYTVKVTEKDGNDWILDEYEVGCWDILTNSFSKIVFEITKRFVESKYSNQGICEDIIQQLIDFREKLKNKYK